MPEGGFPDSKIIVRHKPGEKPEYYCGGSKLWTPLRFSAERFMADGELERKLAEMRGVVSPALPPAERERQMAEISVEHYSKPGSQAA